MGGRKCGALGVQLTEHPATAPAAAGWRTIVYSLAGTAGCRRTLGGGFGPPETGKVEQEKQSAHWEELPPLTGEKLLGGSHANISRFAAMVTTRLC